MPSSKKQPEEQSAIKICVCHLLYDSSITKLCTTIQLIFCIHKGEHSTSGGMVVPVCLLQQSVQTLLEPLLSADITCISAVVMVDGFHHGCDSAVVTGFVDDQPQFKCVRNGFVINGKTYLLCSDLLTLGYDQHYHAYAVTHLAR